MLRSALATSFVIDIFCPLLVERLTNFNKNESVRGERELTANAIPIRPLVLSGQDRSSQCEGNGVFGILLSQSLAYAVPSTTHTRR
jgi:hypothetical protein